MGFLGEFGAGMIYEWESPHSVEFSLGTYKIQTHNKWQSNFAYRYSCWNIERENRQWVPMQIGFFTTRAWDSEHYFLEGPSQYPYSNYYDQTAFRWGIEFGSVLTYLSARVAIAYHMRILDTGIIAIYNNGKKDLQYYVSSGLALRFNF